MEFANLLIHLYGEQGVSRKIGVKSDWFSNDPKFNEQIDSYNIQKQEIKDIVKTFQNVGAQ